MPLGNTLNQLKNTPPYKRNRVIFGAIAGGFFLILIVGLVLNVTQKGNTGITQDRVKLTIWDPLDNQEVYRELIQAYRAQNPNVEVEYINKRVEKSGLSVGESYRKLITEALASGEGPDVYLIGNSWLPIEKGRILPMNSLSETLNRESEQDSVGIDAVSIIGEYPDVVRFDFTREEDGETIIYALPLFIDTLALYYNADYFNSYNFLNAPATLEELVEYVKTIRILDGLGGFKLSGVALGASDTHGVIEGGDNVNHAADIVNLFMLQAGAKMNDTFGRVTFDEPAHRGEKTFFPGRDAFIFYTSFADSSSENYSWDPSGQFSVDAFSNGSTAMMINYADKLNLIKDKNPNLNFKVGLMPQPQSRLDKVNYANYWGLTVAKLSKNPEVAWDFIRFITQEETAKKYLEATSRPPALKALIDDFQDNPEIKPFANQILTAKSWFQPNVFDVERITINAIKDIMNGENITTTINNAQNKMNNLRI